MGLCWTSGYLISDLLTMLVAEIDSDYTSDYPFYLHHVGLVLTIQMAFTQMDYLVVVLCLMNQLAMVVNICLSARWLLHQHNRGTREWLSQRVVAVVTGICYFVFRVSA